MTVECLVLGGMSTSVPLKPKVIEEDVVNRLKSKRMGVNMLFDVADMNMQQ